MIVDMVWVVSLVLAWVVGLIVVVARVRRNQRLLQEMRDLMVGGRHQQVIDHALPAKPFAEQARSMQVTSAVLTGRFALALELLAASADDGAHPPASGASSASQLRAVSLVGLGRYGDVARMLGDRPPMGSLRRVRAQAAIEVGATNSRRLCSPTPTPTRSTRQGGYGCSATCAYGAAAWRRANTSSGRLAPATPAPRSRDRRSTSRSARSTSPRRG